jgi:beta-phosphoglucomutase-like phosphatase (HAD superfamily)
LTEDDFERSKPHPDAYLAALKRLGLPADLCLAVEDSPRGLVSASSAGLRCVLVPTALTDLEMCGDAARVVKDLSDMVSVVLDETGLKSTSTTAGGGLQSTLKGDGEWVSALTTL